MPTTTIVIDHNKPAKENFKQIRDALANNPQRIKRAKAYGEKLAQMSDTDYLNTLDPYEREIAAYQLNLSDDEYKAYIQESV